MNDIDRFFERLYKENYNSLSQYIYRLVLSRETAEDILQDTFIEAYRKKYELVYHESPVGWLYLAARNKVMKLRAKERRYFCVQQEGLEIPVAEEQYSVVEFQEMLGHILTEEEITILEKVFHYGYTGREMADMLGISENCFRTKLCRMREKLRKFWYLGILFLILIIR